MVIAIRAAQYVVGSVLLLSGIYKAFELDQFSLVVRYNIPFLPLHALIDNGIATAICVWEVVLGVYLITGHAARLITALSFCTLCVPGTNAL